MDKVTMNKGAPGVDRMTVDELLYLSKYLSRVNKHIWRDKWGILKTYVTA